MKKRNKKKTKKKTQRKALKKKRVRANSRLKKQPRTINLQKIVGFKLQTLNKVYESFKKKQEKEKVKQDKLESKDREKQIKKEQRELKEEEKQLKKEEENRLKEINKKHKGDRQAISKETMKLYKEQGISPFGCLGPFALQFPIFIGMFFAIRDTLSTTPEALVGLGPKLYSSLPFVDSAIPVNSRFLWLNLGAPDPSPLIMPALVGLSTFVLSKMSMASKNADPRQASMAKTMTWMMPIFLAFITFSFPSGLALYWISSNLVGIIIQYFTSGWGGLFPSKEPTTDNEISSKELTTDGRSGDGQRIDISENSGGGNRTRNQRTKRSSKRSTDRHH